MLIAASLANQLVLVISVLFLAWIGASFVSLLIARRRSGLTHVQESTALPWDIAQVWALISPAETGPVLDANIRRGYQVPGTPTGVGERQAFELSDGTTSVIEIVEHVAGRRAVAVQVSPRPEPVVRYVYTLDPVPDGCVYTFAAEVADAGAKLPAGFDQVWRQTASTQFERLRSVLAANNVPPHGG